MRPADREAPLVILVGMTNQDGRRTVGPKGQVVIPKPMRDALGLRPGDDVAFALDGETVLVRRAAATQPLLGRFRGLDLVADLARDRDDAGRREERRSAT